MVAKTPTTTGFSRKWALVSVAMVGLLQKVPPRQPRLASSGECFGFLISHLAGRILVETRPQFFVGRIHAPDVGLGGSELMASPGAGSGQVADPAAQTLHPGSEHISGQRGSHRMAVFIKEGDRQ